MTVSPDIKPFVSGFGGTILDWERSLDPWHSDAFPSEFKGAAPRHGKRRKGWMAVDAFGNSIMFLPDGAAIP